MGNEAENDLKESLFEINTKLNQARAILNAYGDEALMTQHSINQEEAQILRIAHEQNTYLYHSAFEFMSDAIEKLNNLLEAM